MSRPRRHRTSRKGEDIRTALKELLLAEHESDRTTIYIQPPHLLQVKSVETTIPRLVLAAGGLPIRRWEDSAVDFIVDLPKSESETTVQVCKNIMVEQTDFQINDTSSIVGRQKRSTLPARSSTMLGNTMDSLRRSCPIEDRSLRHNYGHGSVKDLAMVRNICVSGNSGREFW
jgi:hypothetical protein